MSFPLTDKELRAPYVPTVIKDWPISSQQPIVGPEKLEVTDWFPGTKKPVYPGIYERNSGGEQTIFSKWTGEYWCVGDISYRVALASTAVSLSQTSLRWRGILAQ